MGVDRYAVCHDGGSSKVSCLEYLNFLVIGLGVLLIGEDGIYILLS